MRNQPTWALKLICRFFLIEDEFLVRNSTLLAKRVNSWNIELTAIASPILTLKLSMLIYSNLPNMGLNQNGMFNFFSFSYQLKKHLILLIMCFILPIYNLSNLQRQKRIWKGRYSTCKISATKVRIEKYFFKRKKGWERWKPLFLTPNLLSP